VRRLLATALALTAIACAQTRDPHRLPSGSGPLIGIYKAAIDDGTGAIRRAKLSIWAEAPDRLHAELLGAIGGVSFVLDAGGGRLYVIDVGEATAYVGSDGPAAIEALIGVRVAAGDAVGALLSGTAPPGLAVTRDGGSDGGLPEELRIADGARSLVLTRIRFERGTGDAAGLGTGIPKTTMSRRPIEELSAPPSGRNGDPP